jgi:hypothetical protein
MGMFLFFFLLLAHLAPAHAEDYSNLGWPESLTGLYQQLSVTQKNYVLLVSRMPSIPVDFRSNEGLHNSINSFSFQKNFHPGHEMIGWKCRIDGAPFETMLGLSGESNDQHKGLLEDGWGLTSLLATFKDGFIQTPDELENRLKYFISENAKYAAAGDKKRITLISTVIEITEADCENLVNESFEFMNHPNNPVEKFSMVLSPEKYEGAGCGSFVAHFLERIESLKGLMPLFRRQFSLPNYLFGTGKSPLPNDVEIPEQIKKVALKKPVSKIKLISSSWTSSIDPAVNVEILDPELLVFWQKLIFETYFDQHKLSKQKKSFNKSMTRGFWEKVQDLYQPESSHNQYVTIDTNYDQRTKSINALHSRIVENKNLTYFTFLNFPGIILENK